MEDKKMEVTELPFGITEKELESQEIIEENGDDINDTDSSK